MNNVEQQTKRKWHGIDVKGVWELTYKVTNSLGPEAFGGKHLAAYASPFDQQTVWLKGVNGEAKNGMIMDNLVMRFNPDKDVDHKNKVSWLICHPEVKLKGVPNVPQEVLDAKERGKITLTCKTFEEMDDIEQDDFIDKILGRLTLEGGPKAIGLTRLRHILAYLNMPYADGRYEGATEKKILRSKLKKYVKKSYEDAQLVEKAIDDVDTGKAKYEFKEMVNHKILSYNGVIYKYNNVPVGGSFEEAEKFFNLNPEVREAALSKLYKIIE